MGVRREAPDFGSLVSLAYRWAPAAPLAPMHHRAACLRCFGATCARLGIDGKKCGGISPILLTIEQVFVILGYLLPRDRVEVRVPQQDERSDDELVDALDDSHRQIAHSQRELFRLIAESDRRDVWRGSGARDMAQWL